ncbi:MAG: P1 family peptidase [Gemmatimonadales bacterium]
MRIPICRPRSPGRRAADRARTIRILALTLTFTLMASDAEAQEGRARARELGVAPGIFQPGRYNAITDVAGLAVGQTTVWEADSIRTGVTVILPHTGNLFDERVPAALYVANGFGKLLGVTQLRELGELETPIALTCTLCVWRVADALVEYLLAQPGMAGVRSINPVVGETNDGYLNDIRVRPVRAEHVVSALESAVSGPVEEGAVGAGTGTMAFGWKGGIGTSSRVLPDELGGWTVGVLVQSNFGGLLTIDGAPVGRELGRYTFRRYVEPERDADGDDPGDGSIMIVVATDAPLSNRNLERLAARAVHGLARTGSPSTNGSGDYVIAFSSAESVRRSGSGRTPREVADLPNSAMSPLFQAVVEATEEAIYNSLFKAVTVSGHRGTAEALPIQETLEILERYGAIRR